MKIILLQKYYNTQHLINNNNINDTISASAFSLYCRMLVCLLLANCHLRGRVTLLSSYNKRSIDNNKHSSWGDVRTKQKRITVTSNKTRNDQNLCKLKDVQKFISMHVYRFTPETTSENEIDFLKSSFPEIAVKQFGISSTR